MTTDNSDYSGLPTLTVEALNNRVYEILRAAIINGVLAPGQRLVEDAIAGRMGVSRAPVREAIRMLESEGLVRSLHRRGATVSMLYAPDVREIYGLRTALECWAAREACLRATSQDMEELRALVARMEEESRSREMALLVSDDVLFHRRICQIAGNRRILQAWLAMMGQVQMLSRQVISTLYQDLSDVPRRHHRILESIGSGDAEEAERCVREHIASVARRIIAAFPEPALAITPGSSHSHRRKGRRRTG